VEGGRFDDLRIIEQSKRPLTRESSAPVRRSGRWVKPLAPSEINESAFRGSSERRLDYVSDVRAAQAERSSVAGGSAEAGLASRDGPAAKRAARASPGFEGPWSCLQIVSVAEVDERRVARSARA